ncbi:MAG: hypothetical protein WC340_00030 [Kiritimatiellia bacterium]
MRYRTKHVLEYAALRTVAAIFNVLPYKLAIGAGYGLAWPLFHLIRFRRAETFRRIREVLGADTPEREVKRIAWISLRNMLLNAVEMMRASHIDKQWIDDQFPGFGELAETVRQTVKNHGGAIIAVPHTGNWDLAGWAYNQYGVQMFSIAAKQKNPLVNRWINQQRETGIMILERGGGTLKQIIRLLRQGSVLAILPDVRVYIPDLELDFLGGRANLGRGMAQFAITAKVPIIPAVFTRVGCTKHTGKTFDIILPDPALAKADNIVQMTTKVITLIDQTIRDQPEQWFWYNKRWVLTPVHRSAQKN